jgi:hypothetical protein
MSDDIESELKRIIPDEAQQTLWKGPYPQAGIANATIGGDYSERRYFVQDCFETLRKARLIRQDKDLMTEIRAYIRAQRDELSATLDDL